MSETVTEAATNPTEASTSAEASGATLVTATDATGIDPQQGVTTETQQAAEGKTETAETKPEGAPEKYEFTAPEGKEYDATVLESFSEAAKEANLTQDAAQKLLDKVAPALASRQQEQIEAITTEWVETSKSDKEFGGEKLPENLGIAKKALDHFGTPELRTLLENSKLGNHPEVIRLLFRAGKAISEDSFVGGNPSNKTALSAVDVLYPTMKKE